MLRPYLGRFRLLVAGSVKKGEESHFNEVNGLIEELGLTDVVDRRIGYIPEEEVELYFKSTDVLVLPYRRIFQSGVLLLAYNFGVPVVVSDAGSLPEEVVEGQTGYVFRCGSPPDLAAQIRRYFESELFHALPDRREWIVNYANKHYSWKDLAAKTRDVYSRFDYCAEEPGSAVI
jgi:glycosyltransferase involved in cell wall biosynthesis